MKRLQRFWCWLKRAHRWRGQIYLCDFYLDGRYEGRRYSTERQCRICDTVEKFAGAPQWVRDKLDGGMWDAVDTTRGVGGPALSNEEQRTLH